MGILDKLKNKVELTEDEIKKVADSFARAELTATLKEKNDLLETEKEDLNEQLFKSDEKLKKIYENLGISENTENIDSELDNKLEQIKEGEKIDPETEKNLNGEIAKLKREIEKRNKEFTTVKEEAEKLTRSNIEQTKELALRSELDTFKIKPSLKRLVEPDLKNRLEIEEGRVYYRDKDNLLFSVKDGLEGYFQGEGKEFLEPIEGGGEYKVGGMFEKRNFSQIADPKDRLKAFRERSK
jgi:hypothetical protein